MYSVPEALRPFTIAVPDAELEDLARRLENTRWPDELPDAGWDYGVPLAHVRELVDHWRHGFDWRAAEARLNEWPQFLTEIDGATIHLAHLRSPEPDATPLLMSHGWPGSIVEFTEIAPLLVDPRSHGGDPRDAFHLVLPSLPGYGFSGPTRERGWEFRRIAAAFDELMRRLGYGKYVVQGGDWGSAVSRELGRVHPDRVLGVHLNFVPGAAMTSDPDAPGAPELSPEELDRARRSWRRFQHWQQERAGYGVQQASRPQTLAYALTDSPVGQLAWIAEKFAEWSDTRAGQTSISRDHLLTNVMVYWVTRTAGSSARLYYERAHADYWGKPDPPSLAPTAFADFPEEIHVVMRHVVEQANHVVRWTSFDRGGHFAALEQPQALAEDIRAFVRDLRASS